MPPNLRFEPTGLPSVGLQLKRIPLGRKQQTAQRVN
jgi:hypothetical protein